MAFSTLLACLRVDKPNADLLAVVRETAERHRSAVIGLVAKQAEAHSYAGGAGPVEPPGHDLHRFMERAAAAEQEFREALSPIEPLDWRAELTLGPAYEHVANEARGADLVIAPLDQNDRHMFPSGQPEVGDLLMSLGRPLLAVPAGAGGLKLNASLVCWKESREARRAVADALPMLQASRRVDVVEIVPTKATEAARLRVADVVAWLARHDVEANGSTALAAGTEATQLAAIARDGGADLIVAGAFGHSRLRQWAFGGVTRDLLLVADRCVLASH